MGRIRLAKAKPSKYLKAIDSVRSDKGYQPAFTFKIKVKVPSEKSDFSYQNNEYWFSSMKKQNMRFPDNVYIMHVCPKTKLLMTLNSTDVSTKDKNGMDLHAIEANGWVFEQQAVQRAYNGWLAERILLDV